MMLRHLFGYESSGVVVKSGRGLGVLRFIQTLQPKTRPQIISLGADRRKILIGVCLQTKQTKPSGCIVKEQLWSFKIHSRLMAVVSTYEFVIGSQSVCGFYCGQQMQVLEKQELELRVLLLRFWWTNLCISLTAVEIVSRLVQ
jgi:hypothetical protein